MQKRQGPRHQRPFAYPMIAASGVVLQLNRQAGRIEQLRAVLEHPVIEAVDLQTAFRQMIVRNTGLEQLHLGHDLQLRIVPAIDNDDLAIGIRQ